MTNKEFQSFTGRQHELRMEAAELKALDALKGGEGVDMAVIDTLLERRQRMIDHMHSDLIRYGHLGNWKQR